MTGLAQVLAATRAIADATPTRATVRSGPFAAYVETGRPDRWFSWAVPDDGAEPTDAEVAALREVFAAHDRVPRVECFPALAPVAVEALLARGFGIELRGPVMTCAAHVQAPAPAGITFELLTPESSDEVIAAYDGVQTRAFGGGTDAPVDLDAYRARLTQHINLLARLDGVPAATGVVTDPVLGCSEVAGIGTEQSLRGRGIAGALVAELTGRAFARGAEVCFLTAGGEDSRRVYERAGFVLAGEYAHLATDAGPGR